MAARTALWHNACSFEQGPALYRMSNPLRITMLAAAIGLALVAVPPAAAEPAGLEVSAPVATGSTAPQTYIVRFAEPGLLHYGGGTQGMPATALGASGQRRLDTRSGAAREYQRYLADHRATHLAAIAASLGRELAVTHHYAITMNGIAASMTPEEAARVARVPGVASVRASRQFALDTYRGPEYIGAESVWTGSAVPGGVGTRGQGVVVGVVDSGSYVAHPSFANDPACGFDDAHPKFLSAVDCSTTDADGVCNGETPEADPGNGHGVHTASTAVGNRLDANANPPPTIPPPHTFMSGVAPCAAIRTYKVCPISGCTDAAITAGIENAIADRVDVVNFSIGEVCGTQPGESPWSNGDETWLDALGTDIFVAASAGNTRGSCPDPTAKVGNIGPWVTTLAASTHDENVAGFGTMSATGPGAPPIDTQHISMVPGSGLDVGQAMDDVEIRFYAANPIGCTVNGGFPPGYFDGAVALIERGNCAYEEKINNAEAAGAVLAVIYNNHEGFVQMGVGGATLPAYGIQQADGEAYIAFIGASLPSPVTIDFRPAVSQGDVLAGFSLRGPDVLTSITKPDLTAPGVTIFAALDAPENNYGYLSGTSMSAPHAAGAAALVRAIHPAWTPSEVKSALMLTASNDGTREDLVTPWKPDDVGNGRVDLTRAALAGFVLDETYAHYVAADPASGGDPKTLNLASLRNVDGCDAPGTCTWTRTLRGVLPGASSWSVSVNAPPGLAVTVDPPTFSFGGTGADGDTLFRDGFEGNAVQAITVAATTDPELRGMQFADVVFHEASGAAPDAHMPVAVKGSNDDGAFGVDCAAGTCTFRVDALATQFVAIGCESWCGILWFNRFTPEPADYPITITSISTIFGNGTGWNAAGDRINVYIYQDADTDPRNGAVLAGMYQGYTMGAPFNDFTTITLPTPVVVSGPGDVLIGLTNPVGNVGSQPASADTGPFAGRSWVASFEDSGTPPNFTQLALFLNPDGLAGFDGNWLIRATGTNAAGRPIVLGLPAKN